MIASCIYDKVQEHINTVFTTVLNGLMCARQASKHINIYIKILWDTILISSNHGTYIFSNHSCLQFINSTAVCIFSSNTYRLNDCLVFYAASVVFQSYNPVPLLQTELNSTLLGTYLCSYETISTSDFEKEQSIA